MPGSAGWLTLLCVSRAFAATWFVAYSAVLPLTRVAWELSAREAGMIQGAYHIGYLLSLFSVGLLGDRFGAKRALILMGIGGLLTPLAFVAFANGFWSALLLYALTGLTQGGFYTPLLALISEHVVRERRGRAMGYLIAASSAGHALSLALAGVMVTLTGWRGALTALAILPAFAWLAAVVALRHTPNIVHARPQGRSVFASIPELLADRKAMSSVWAYTCHSWETLGLWAWLPAFLTAALLMGGSGAGEAAGLALGLSAMTYAANIGGSILGGTLADRWGRMQTILLCSTVSLVMSFSFGWTIGLPIALIVAFACLYNFSAVTDSSVHSTLIAEIVPPHALGAAYATRSVLGFGAGAISPVVFGWALDLAGGGKTSADAFAWGIAWATLGVGALYGPVAIWRLRRMQRN